MKNPLFCAIDFETSGVDTEKDEIIEFGYVLFDYDNIYLMNNYLIQPSFRISEQVELLTGIKNEHLEKMGVSHMAAFTTFIGDLYYTGIKRPDFYVGHNARAFDSKFLSRYLNLFFNSGSEISEEIKSLVNKTKWVDTMLDIPYPDRITTKKLTYLAAEHKFFNQNAHRALFDCLACAHLVRSYSWESIEEKMSVKNYIITCSPQPPWIDGGKSKDKAKELGFKWNPSEKIWHRTAKETELENLIENSYVNLQIKELVC